jgi:peptide/nickel transport system permease protein
MTAGSLDVQAALRARPLSPLRLDRLRPGVVFSVLVLVLAAVATIAPQLLTAGDPLAANPALSHRPPSPAHPAGTDLQGRDVLVRIIYGARYSMLIGLGATVVAVGLGVAFGVLAGVLPGWADRGISRLVDVVAAFPEVLLALLMIAFTGRGVVNLVLALGVAGLPKYARTVRANVKLARSAGYVEQARTFGLSGGTLVLRHVLPNALGALPVMITIGLGGAIIGSSGLSFLGLGPQPPAAEWGLMLSESRAYLRQAWWSGVFPGVALTLVVIAATVLGRALQAGYERRNR